MFIDSHCHIDGAEYDADREDVISRAHDAGVTTMLNVVQDCVLLPVMWSSLLDACRIIPHA